MKKGISKFLGFILAGLFASGLALAQTTDSSMTPTMTPNNMTPKMDIIQAAMENRELSTLAGALKAADLVGTLKGVGPFTVFAPSNAAFAALPKGALQKLLHNKKELVAILTYHVVPGEVMSANLQNGPLKTVQGQDLTIAKTDQGITVNNAKVIKSDIKTSNGVVYVIDTVLMPPKTTM